MVLCLLSRNPIWLTMFLDSMAVGIFLGGFITVFGVPCAREREPWFVLCGLTGVD